MLNQIDGGEILKRKMSTGMKKLRAPGSARLATIALEGLKKRCDRSQRGGISLSEAAAMLGCDQGQVVDKIGALIGGVSDMWDWGILHGDDFVAVGRRFTRREAALVKKLVKLPDFEQVARLPPPPRMFRAAEAARILKIPPRKATAWLVRCVRMGYLNWCTLVPPGGQKGLRWQRRW
jgi:hypothetical protein